MRQLYKNVGNAFLNRASKFLVRVQLFLQLKLGFFQTYAPNAFISENKTSSDDRASFERLNAINKFLPPEAKPTIIDIGCKVLDQDITFQCLVKPESKRRVDDYITTLTGITNQMLSSEGKQYI